MPTDRFPDARDDDDELTLRVGRLRSDLHRRRTRAMATGIVMVLDDIDAGDADLLITACAGHYHLDVDTLAATICRTLRYP